LKETERALEFDVPVAAQLSPSACALSWGVRSPERTPHLRLESNIDCSDGTMPEPSPEFDHDEVLVCMVLAFCLAGASVSVIYGVMG